MKDKKIGVKRIGLIDSYKEWAREESENSFVIKDGSTIRYEVKEWYPDTKEKHKKDIRWLLKSDNAQTLNYYESAATVAHAIPLSLCGSKQFTLQAYIKDQTEPAEILIRGETTPLVLASGWVIEDDGVTVEIKNREKKSPIPYGKSTKLYLETQGLNGNYVLIEIFAVRTLNESINLKTLMGDATANDVLVYRKKWKCIDGEINIPITTQDFRLRLGKGKDIELLYVKVKKSSDYIKDGHPYFDILHAVGLCMKNETVNEVQTIAEVPTNTSTTRVGSNPVNAKEYAGCTFEKIILTENGFSTVLFENGKTHRPEVTNKRHYIKEFAVYFDVDKDQLDKANQEQLKTYALYFIETNTAIKLQGYADNSGSNRHNDELAARRVETVKKLLIGLGVNPQNIGADSYGEYKATGEKVQHDRRVSMFFDVMASNHKSIIYETVTPDGEAPVTINLQVEGYTNAGCFMPEGHKHEPELSVGEMDNPDLIKFDKNETEPKIVLDIHSDTYEMSYWYFLSLLAMRERAALVSDKIDRFAKIYKFNIRTCTYFSGKNVPAVILIAYPDARLVYHFRYDYEKDYFFEDIPVKLIKGSPFVHEAKEILDKYLVIPLSLLLQTSPSAMDDDALDVKTISDLIWEEILERIDLFQTGVHALYNFRGNDHKVTDYTAENRITTEISHILYATYQVIIELIILYLTRGKGSKTKIKAQKKINKALKFMEDNNLSFITPKVAESFGVYYKKINDGRVARIYKVNWKADPLIGVEYKKEFDLTKEEDRKNILKKSSLREWFEKAALNTGGLTDAKMEVKIAGRIGGEFNLEINTLTGMVDGLGFKENFQHALNKGSVSITTEQFIEGIINFKIKGQAVEEIQLLPLVEKDEVKIGYELRGEKITMGIKWQRTYNFSATEPSYRDKFIFTGIKGKYYQRIEIFVEGKEKWDTNPKRESVPFELLPEMTFSTDPIKLPFT